MKQSTFKKPISIALFGLFLFFGAGPFLYGQCESATGGNDDCTIEGHVLGASVSETQVLAGIQQAGLNHLTRDFPMAFSFPCADIMALINQNGCVGIRAYFAMTTQGDINTTRLILEAVNLSGNGINDLDKPFLGFNADDTKGKDVIQGTCHSLTIEPKDFTGLTGFMTKTKAKVGVELFSAHVGVECPASNCDATWPASYLFCKTNIEYLVSQEDAAGLRFYMGVESEDNSHALAMVAYNDEKVDICSEEGISHGQEAYFLDRSLPCPDFCRGGELTEE